ncbi:hypothetical protein XMG59_001588 [Marinobacterium sp. xm-g-59]|uniref:hypothetical protein n=1 Tax=Marinobacterium sp. xm-g-59 TaxID=2497748 RepID=UPI00156A307D|nr:hypothetical protein [Marinobacterium sp. xm-g-59]NRP95484.1 hypothetical protein [Marinobacterium sp. xm-g-59]
MRILVCYPVRHTGGAQNLIARVSTQLARSFPVQLIVCDFVDGYVKSVLEENSIEFDFFEYDELSQLRIDGDCVFLTPLSELSNFNYDFLPSSIKILTWAIHPSGFLSFFRYRSVYTKFPVRFSGGIARVLEFFRFRQLREMIGSLTINGGLISMDAANSSSMSSFFTCDFAMPIIPIGIELNQPCSGENFSRCGPIEFVWLGRIDKDKYRSILHVGNTLSFLADHFGRDLVLHVIGEGDSLSRLKKQSFEGVEMRYPGTLSGAALDDYLKTGLYVGFAMGTSVLELVKLNVLTFTIDLIRFRGVFPFTNIYLFSSCADAYLGDVSYMPKKTISLDQFKQCLSSYDATCLDQSNFLHGTFDVTSISSDIYDRCLTTKVTWAMLRTIL